MTRAELMENVAAIVTGVVAAAGYTLLFVAMAAPPAETFMKLLS